MSPEPERHQIIGFSANNNEEQKETLPPKVLRNKFPRQEKRIKYLDEAIACMNRATQALSFYTNSLAEDESQTEQEESESEEVYTDTTWDDVSTFSGNRYG